MTTLVARSRGCRVENQRLLARSHKLIAISRRVVNPAWGVSGAADGIPSKAIARASVIRHQAATVLGERYPDRFICIACLGPLVRDALGTTYTKGQVERALRAAVAPTWGFATKRFFVCDQCGMRAICLGFVTERTPAPYQRQAASTALFHVADVPDHPHATPGVIYIDRDGRARDLRTPSSFLVSFGGDKDGKGTFYLGRASGFDALSTLLATVGVLSAEVDTAIQTLTAQPHHRVPNVNLQPDVLRKLGS